MDETQAALKPSKRPRSRKRRQRSLKSSHYERSLNSPAQDNLREQEAVNTLKNLSPPTLISEPLLMEDEIRENITGWDSGFERKKPKCESRTNSNLLALTSKNFLSVLSQSLAQAQRPIQEGALTELEINEEEEEEESGNIVFQQYSRKNSHDSKLPPRIGIFFRNQGKESSLINELKKIKDFLLSPKNKKKGAADNFTSLSEIDQEKNERSLDSAGASTEVEDNSRAGPLSPSKNQR